MPSRRGSKSSSVSVPVVMLAVAIGVNGEVIKATCRKPGEPLPSQSREPQQLLTSRGDVGQDGVVFIHDPRAPVGTANPSRAANARHFETEQDRLIYISEHPSAAGQPVALPLTFRHDQRACPLRARTESSVLRITAQQQGAIMPSAHLLRFLDKLRCAPIVSRPPDEAWPDLIARTS